MANFCDRLLRKNTTDKLSDSEIEAYLEQTVSLFMYLTDKDFFSEVYRNLLAKRLLNQRSASDDMERVMIGKLKSKTGAQFTAKMEGMMTDLAIGMEQSASFEKFCKETPGMLGGKLSFSVQILTTGHWPQYKYYNEIVLPSSMLKCMETFKMYYDNMTNNNKRKLTWVYSLGNVNIKGSFNNFKKTYDINVTTLQAAVMLMFNGSSASTGNKDTDMLLSQGIASFAYLQETLNIPEDVLKKVLHSLCFAKFKIVKKISSSEVNRVLGVEGAGEEAKEEKEAKGVKKTDYFQFNDSFS
jgi:cullin 1